MPDPSSISESESLVMDILWTRAPQTADEIVAALSASTDWQKGVVRAEYEGRRYLYSPALQRADWVDAQSRSVLDRLFGGRVAPLVAHFSERQALSRDDIAELRKLIDGLDK